MQRGPGADADPRGGGPHAARAGPHAGVHLANRVRHPVPHDHRGPGARVPARLGPHRGAAPTPTQTHVSPFASSICSHCSYLLTRIDLDTSKIV